MLHFYHIPFNFMKRYFKVLKIADFCYYSNKKIAHPGWKTAAGLFLNDHAACFHGTRTSAFASVVHVLWLVVCKVCSFSMSGEYSSRATFAIERHNPDQRPFEVLVRIT